MHCQLLKWKTTFGFCVFYCTEDLCKMHWSVLKLLSGHRKQRDTQLFRGYPHCMAGCKKQILFILYIFYISCFAEEKNQRSRHLLNKGYTFLNVFYILWYDD